MFLWIFMLACILLVPLMMIIFGRVFTKKAPKDINYVYGYRTPMSTSSKDAWEFAHKYIGKLWLLIGTVILIPSIMGMILVIGLDDDTIGYTGMAITFAQMFIMILPVIPTEIVLRKNFDKNGNRKI